MIIIIYTLEQNVILKNKGINQDRQNMNPWRSFLKYLIFPTLIKFLTLLLPSLNSHILLYISTNQKSPTELLEPILIYDNHREDNILSFNSITFLSGYIMISTKVDLTKAANRDSIKLNGVETSIIIFFLFIIDYISCFFLFRLLLLSYLFWKKFQHTEKFYRKISLTTSKQLPL